jgi:hypothetical protein
VEFGQEFEPWLKWVIMDALLSLAISILTRHAKHLKPIFNAIGWL